MANNDVLYFKGMDKMQSDSEETGSGNDEWDDRQMIAAYEKALHLANVDVAQRIAMATNSKAGPSKGPTKQKQSKSTPNKNKKQWKCGMPCRAVYEGDGLEYEGFILRLMDDNECLVRFLGYDNPEIVSMDSVKPSHGKEAQERQVAQASMDKPEDSDSNHPDVLDHSEHEILEPPPIRMMPNLQGSSCDGQTRKKVSKRRGPKNQRLGEGFHLPPPPTPDISKLRHMNADGMRMLAPPPPYTSLDGEEQAVSNMLLSWYMSGYYTGLYQGLRRRGKKNDQEDEEEEE